jgi:hypothetical protein
LTGEMDSRSRPPDGGREHWARVYTTRAADSVSWHQAEPAVSMGMIVRATRPPARVIDVGAGTSFLVDRLLEEGYQPTLLDIAAEPLDVVRDRLGPVAKDVDWLVADITTFHPDGIWDVWHDRAVFHFLTNAQDRDRYRQRLLQATTVGSSVIVATFGPHGPDRCSGLPTVRYAPEELHQELGSEFELKETAVECHVTPGGATQGFIYCRFRRE